MESKCRKCSQGYGTEFVKAFTFYKLISGDFEIKSFFRSVGRVFVQIITYAWSSKKIYDKLYLLSTTPAFTKNNYTIFTKSAVHKLK